MLQLAVAARLERMNADNAGSVVKLIHAAQQSANALADAAGGIGANLDVTAVAAAPANSAGLRPAPISGLQSNQPTAVICYW